MTYTHLLHLALPEVIIVITSVIVLGVDLFILRNSTTKTRFTAASLIATLGCAAAIFHLVYAPQQAILLNGVFLSTPLINTVQIILLALSILTLLLSTDSTFTDHVGEFVTLILFATIGMMFLVATQDLLVLFLSLELLSLSLYILTAFNKHSPRSSEAALKYFLFGAMSAAFLLFGFSLFYGLASSTSFTQIAAAIQAAPLNPLVIIAIVTTLVGFGFKVAAVPFHFWAPDVYQAAPIPAATLIASSSKVASFFIFFEFMAIALNGTSGAASWHPFASGLHFATGWTPVLALIAAASMILGNLVAIRQTSVRRLLAYSAIAHAGYMLLAIVAHTPQSLSALLYYVTTYALTTIGAFAIVGVVEQQTGSDDLSSFNGLSRRAPILSACLFVFMLSLAGIPPLAGFFGKFFLFVAVVSIPGLVWLVILAIAGSAVSLFYYLQVLKRAYVTDPEADIPLKTPPLTQLIIVLLAVSVILFGCVPNLLIH